MGNQIKLPTNAALAICRTLGKVAKTTAESVGKHKVVGIFAGLSLIALGDNIRLRLARRKDQKMFEESAVKQQAIIRKHEAEIKALMAEAERAQKERKRVGQIEQILNNITGGDTSK